MAHFYCATPLAWHLLANGKSAGPSRVKEQKTNASPETDWGVLHLLRSAHSIGRQKPLFALGIASLFVVFMGPFLRVSSLRLALPGSLALILSAISSADTTISVLARPPSSHTLSSLWWVQWRGSSVRFVTCHLYICIFPFDVGQFSSSYS